LILILLYGWGNAVAHQSTKPANLVWTGAFDLIATAWLVMTPLMFIITIIAPVARVTVRPGTRVLDDHRLQSWSLIVSIITAIAAVLALFR
jgi:hypothetical protein